MDPTVAIFFAVIVFALGVLLDKYFSLKSRVDDLEAALEAPDEIDSAPPRAPSPGLPEVM